MTPPAWLLSLIACPYDGTALRTDGQSLVCSEDHSFPVVDGVPVLLRDDAPRTHSSIEKTLSEIRDKRVGELRLQVEADSIDPVVQVMVAATCGRLYSPVVGKLNRYPIPRSRLRPGAGRTLLDVGCNWGRWTLSAARNGYRAVGLDPDLGPVLAATRVARQLGLSPGFVVGDARSLPFRQDSVDAVFSYSVIQHLSKDDAHIAFSEIARVLKPGGTSTIQMPNAHSLLGMYRRLRNPRPSNFDVRDWTPREILEGSRRIGTTTLTVDGYFGLGVQPDDIDLMPQRYRLVIRSSEALRKASLRLPALAGVADSVYAVAEKG